MKLEHQPTVKSLKEKEKSGPGHDRPGVLDAHWIKQLALDCGADDVGLVEIDRPKLDDQRDEILARYPWAKTLLSFVLCIAREPIRSTDRSISNLEFHNRTEEVNDISGKIAERLEKQGIRACKQSMIFPMEMARFPSRIWVIAHKPVAVAAGLGHMGIHQNVIHPKFGNFILLGTVVVEAEATEYDHPIDYNPCFECNLCVATCPSGAISSDGEFNLTACFTHNYHEFMGGFNDWVEQIDESKDPKDFKGGISDPETASFWQSLSFGLDYKSAYCISVCPAGEDVIGTYLNDRKAHFKDVVKPLQDKEETVYVVKGSDPELFVEKRFKNKKIQIVGNMLRPLSVRVFLDSLPFLFQRQQSEGLNATYHFTFTGNEQREATVIIADKKIEVHNGHVDKADISVTADGRTWLGFLAGEKNLAWALVSQKIKIKGSQTLLKKFMKCFPSTDVKLKSSDTVTELTIAHPIKRPYLRNDPATNKIPGITEGVAKWSGSLVADKIILETPRVKTFRLANPDGGEVPFSYMPGQFLTLNLYPGGKHTKRSYTIASTPSRNDFIELTIKREEFGLISRHLHDEINSGALIKVEAPSGSFTFTGGESESIVLISGGVGITPLMSVVRYLTDNEWKGEIYLIMSHKTPDEYIFRDEIEGLEKRHSNLNVLVTMTEADGGDWPGGKGRINKEIIDVFVPNIIERRVHICGPVQMMEAVKTILTELGVPDDRIYIENFGTDKRNPTLKSQKQLGEVVGEVRFAVSDKTASIRDGETVLEVADEMGIEIDNACRSGTCGSCKVHLMSGSVTMDCVDALGEDDKAEGIVLACQSMTKGNVEIDA